MFSFFSIFLKANLYWFCFDLLTELCSCHRHRLPLCPFNHRSISGDKVFPRKTEIPLLVPVCRAMDVCFSESSSGWGREEFSSTGRTFLVCLPLNSSQEASWHFSKIFSNTLQFSFDWTVLVTPFTIGGGWDFDANSQKLSDEQDWNSSTRRIYVSLLYSSHKRGVTSAL